MVEDAGDVMAVVFVVFVVREGAWEYGLEDTAVLDDAADLELEGEYFCSIMMVPCGFAYVRMGWVTGGGADADSR